MISSYFYGMISSMKVDVIVPAYNRAHTLGRALDSVLKQTYKDFNLIIIDDGSTDETPALLEKYKAYPQVYIYTQKNSGVSSARNLGVKSTTSPWISFLDSDDEWLSDKLEKQMAFLNSHPEIKFLHTEEIWVRNGVRVNPKVKHSKSSENIFERSLEHCLISPSTVILDRLLFNECGPFDEEFIVCEDYDLWLKIMAHTPIGFINEPLTIKNGGHDDQLSTKFPAMDYWRIKSLVNLYKKNDQLNEEVKGLIRNIIIKKSEILLPGYIKHKNTKAYEEVAQMLKQIMQN